MMDLTPTEIIILAVGIVAAALVVWLSTTDYLILLS